MTKHDPVSFEVLTELFKPLIRQIAEEVMAETPTKEPAQSDLTVAEFSKKHHMGLCKWHELQKTGRGPRVWFCGSQARITPEAEAEWLAGSTNTQRVKRRNWSVPAARRRTKRPREIWAEPITRIPATIERSAKREEAPMTEEER